jgi:hypothetical protein
MNYFMEEEQKGNESRGTAELFYHGKQLISRSDINTTQHLKSLNERYYDSLDPGGKRALSNMWDDVAYLMLKSLRTLKNYFKTADPMDKHDLQRQMVEVKFYYEVDRFHLAYQHYLNSKKYKGQLLEEGY